MAHLTSRNVAEFWSDVWATNNTTWKLAERCAPFTRIMCAYLKGAGLLTAKEPTKGDVEVVPNYNAVREFFAGKTVWVPLCGDSAVISYMLECGARHVVGADLSEHALCLQRQTNLAKYSFQTRKLELGDGAKGDIFAHEITAGENRVTLFHGDIMDLPFCKAYTALEMDFMWDRAAMMAIPADLRPAYVQAVTMTLRANAGVAYERMVRLVPKERYWGPPFMVEMEDVLQLYRRFTGRDYRAVRILADDVEGNYRPEWYALLSNK